MAELIYKDEVYAIIGAAMDVYNHLGPGFSEPVYQEAFGIELESRRIPYKPQAELEIVYKGKRLKKKYLADFLAFEKIVLEIKAIDQLGSKEEAQLLNYLKASASPLGVLINFGAINDLEWKRMVFTDYRLRTYRTNRIIRED
jgi:GxxExxY protein